MFTNRLLCLLIVVALMIVTACTPTSSNVSHSPSVEAPTMIQTTTSIKPVPHMPLPPGIYTSEVFDTPLTYTVPTGWKMFEDEPRQFGLALLENDGPCLRIFRDVRAAATTCAEEPEPGVGSSAADIVNWLATRDGLDTTQPEQISVGGLNGYVIDVRIDPSWTGACPFSNGNPTVMTLGCSACFVSVCFEDW